MIFDTHSLSHKLGIEENEVLSLLAIWEQYRQEKIHRLPQSDQSYHTHWNDGENPIQLREEEVSLWLIIIQKIIQEQRECFLQNIREKRQEETYRVFESENLKILGISAPHAEVDVTGGFTGEPTPLLYAMAPLMRKITRGAIPVEVTDILNPSAYNQAFLSSLKESIESQKPDVVLISNISEGHYYAIEIAKMIKKLHPDTIIILGGSNEDGSNPLIYEALLQNKKFQKLYPELSQKLICNQEIFQQNIASTHTYAEPKNQDYIDFVVAGDGEYVLYEIIRQIIVDKKNIANIYRHILSAREDWKQILGRGHIFFPNFETTKQEQHVISFDGGNESHKNHISYRDSLPYIDRKTLSKENRYQIFGGKKTAQVMANVGCVESCAFCVRSTDDILYSQEKVRSRSAQNILGELRSLHAQGYKAIFFDDDNFAQNPKQVRTLLEGMQNLSNEGITFEWGCQTTMRSVDPEIHHNLIEEMHKAGCTYLYTGLEQIAPEKERARNEKASDVHIAKQKTTRRNWAEMFESICKESKQHRIRIGCSLQFGLGETETTWKATLKFVKKMYDQGYIAENSVALNINTPYPETIQWIEIAAMQNPMLNYKKKLQRHLRLETSHQLSSLEVSVADKIYQMAYAFLGEALVGVTDYSAEYEAMNRAYNEKFSCDFYFDTQYTTYLASRENPLNQAAHFNHASLSLPSLKAQRKIEKVNENPIKMLEEIREYFAQYINTSPENILLGRNTTEAISYCFWIAGLSQGDQCLISDAENASVQRAFEWHLDHGNPYGDDPWSTYPTHYIEKGPSYAKFHPNPTGVQIQYFSYEDQTIDAIKTSIQSCMTENTQCIVLSHVLRLNGAKMPIEELCNWIRQYKKDTFPENENIFILVDGAQAFGNIPAIDMQSLGCDAYACTPHKTLQTHPLGILAINPNSQFLRNIETFSKLYYGDEQVIVEGSFDPRINIPANVSDTFHPKDIGSVYQCVQEKHNFRIIDEQRKILKNICIKKLETTFGALYIPDRSENTTNFIHTFRIEGINSLDLCKYLSTKHIFLSALTRHSMSYLRLAFQPDNTESEIDLLIREIQEYINEYIDTLDAK